jgi:hypothetical protein
MSRRVEVPASAGRIAHAVVFGHWLPRLLGFGATTLGATIYVAGGYLSAHHHAHEFCHVLQWRKHGRVGFLLRYEGEMAWRPVQQLAGGNWRSTIKAAHKRHSLERRAELFARLQEATFAAVRADQ